MSDAYIIIKQNEYMRRFRRAGATDPMRAKTLADLGIKASRIFRSMQDKAIFLPGRDPETHYMDTNAAEDFIASRRKRAFLLLLLGLAVVIVLFLLGRR
jgi:hypothetical protein